MDDTGGVGPPHGQPRTRALSASAVAQLPVDGLALVVMGDESSRELVHATDPTVSRLDELQFVMGEGPALDAYRARRPVLVPDMSATTALQRWPGLAHEAREIGVLAAFVFPLHLGAVPFGTVEFYRRRAGPLDGDALPVAERLVGQLAVVVLDELTADGALRPSAEDPPAIFGNSEIDIAAGMIAVQLEISVSDAIARLRAMAFSSGRPIGEIAGQIVTRRLLFAADPADPRPDRS